MKTTKRQFTVRVAPATAIAIRVEAAVRETSVAALLSDLLDGWVAARQLDRPTA